MSVPRTFARDCRYKAEADILVARKIPLPLDIMKDLAQPIIIIITETIVRNNTTKYNNKPHCNRYS